MSLSVGRWFAASPLFELGPAAIDEFAQSA